MPSRRLPSGSAQSHHHQYNDNGLAIETGMPQPFPTRSVLLGSRCRLDTESAIIPAG